jgi:hypothetical protein
MRFPETVCLSKSPEIKITLPEDLIPSASLHSLLKEVMDRTAAAMKTELKDSKEAIIEDGMKRGAAAALMVCKSSLPSEAHWGVVDSQPSCSPYVKEVLGRLAGEYRTQSTKLERWEPTTFTNASKSIRSMSPMERRRVIGYYKGKEIVVLFVGHVDIHQFDDDDDTEGFFGLCEMKVRDGTSIVGYVLGSIYGTGTALVVGEDNSLFIYSPTDAIDRPWQEVKTEGAEIIIENDNTLRISPIVGMQVECFGHH